MHYSGAWSLINKLMVNRVRKKTRLRRRILAAFSAVLFFSFLFTAIIFNIAIRLFSPIDMNIDEHTSIGRAGLILIALVGIMFIVSVIVTYFLSNSITRPIEKLGKFALRIGKGTFEINEYEFQDVELEDLNAALNHSVRQLGVYDRTQKDFFQNASHELRTPLMSIKIYAEGIVYGLMESKKAGETILQETDRLSELVTDLLYIAKIDNATMVYKTEKVNLITVLKDSAEKHEAVAQKNNIGFIFRFSVDSLYSEVIEELISRAVDNLISNAIRYAKSTITLSCLVEDSNFLIIVEDDGSGIEIEALPHVFERFYKGKGGNTGIGLAIVKSIADQHSGKVVAKNKAEGGAVFTLSLPMH